MSVLKAHVVAVACHHCPFQDDGAVDWALNTIEDMRPRPTHFVNLGDLFESDAASVYPNENFHTLEEEYEVAARYLEWYRAVLPKSCNLLWMLGNHDDNIRVADPRRIPWKLRGAVHWNKHGEFGPEFRLWKQYPYIKDETGCYELGPLIFYHGYDTGTNSDELEGLQMAYACGGHAHRLSVRGHTHRPLAVTQCYRTRTVPLAHHVANVGTMGPLKPPYTHRRSTLAWGPAIFRATVPIGASYQLSRGLQWDAEILTP